MTEVQQHFCHRFLDACSRPVEFACGHSCKFRQQESIRNTRHSAKDQFRSHRFLSKGNALASLRAFAVPNPLKIEGSRKTVEWVGVRRFARKKHSRSFRAAVGISTIADNLRRQLVTGIESCTNKVSSCIDLDSTAYVGTPTGTPDRKKRLDANPFGPRHFVIVTRRIEWHASC